MEESTLLRIPTPGGCAVNVRPGSNDSFWSLYGSGSWEPETSAVFRRFMDAQHSYIDIGAWIGPTLLLGCQIANRAYGIEPDPIAYAELSENIQCNRPLTNNVRLFNLCITPVSGKVSFGSRGGGGDSTSSLLFSGEATQWSVDGVNFQDWINDNQISDCNFIKVDIEGGEYSVLPTMLTYLKKSRPTLLLALHPCFLGDLHAQSMKVKVRNSLSRLKNTLRILSMLRFYKYCYSLKGRCPTSAYRFRLIQFVDRIPSKGAVFFLTCLRGLVGRPHELLFTDRKWQ
ncbi:MAG TPA: FkbM family methyltransferase [Terracidiphilus sp.]|nr:FkbM family methyltransferase [Terracidiphilus sp.]